MKNKTLTKVISIIAVTLIAIISIFVFISSNENQQTKFKTIQGYKFDFEELEGKVAIINIEHPHIRIPSISLWKMIPVTRI